MLEPPGSYDVTLNSSIVLILCDGSCFGTAAELVDMSSNPRTSTEFPSLMVLVATVYIPENSISYLLIKLYPILLSYIFCLSVVVCKADFIFTIIYAHSECHRMLPPEPLSLKEMV